MWAGPTTGGMVDAEPDPVLDAPLFTANGTATRLRESLGAVATVVVFVRHFG